MCLTIHPIPRFPNFYSHSSLRSSRPPSRQRLWAICLLGFRVATRSFGSARKPTYTVHSPSAGRKPEQVCISAEGVSKSAKRVAPVELPAITTRIIGSPYRLIPPIPPTSRWTDPGTRLSTRPPITPHRTISMKPENLNLYTVAPYHQPRPNTQPTQDPVTSHR